VTEELELYSRQEQKGKRIIFSALRPTLGLNRAPAEFVLETVARWIKRSGREADNFQLVPGLRRADLYL
jgi:hypothetical protein